MSTPTPTRRERVRRQTLVEIKEHALAQVAEGGLAALSLNAIAKAMGMSGPAIYRYFGSRDELLAELITDGYGELAEIVEQAARPAPRRSPARRLVAAAEAYRAWARANPYRYDLLFSVRPPTYSDPTEAIAAIQPAMGVLLEVLGEIAGAAGASARGGKLDAQLRHWAGLATSAPTVTRHRARAQARRADLDPAARHRRASSWRASSATWPSTPGYCSGPSSTRSSRPRRRSRSAGGKTTRRG